MTPVRFKRVIGGLLLWLLAVAGGCSDTGEGQKESSSPPVSVQQPLSTPEVGLSPPSAHPVTEKTRQTYQWYCAQCHGVHGKGDGINAPYTAVPPRDHTKASYLETRTDEQLFFTIKNGGLAAGRAPCMPSWGHTLDDEMILSLVSYIRELCDCSAI